MIKNILEQNLQYQKLCEIIQKGIFSTEHAMIVNILFKSLTDENEKLFIKQSMSKLFLTKDIYECLNFV